MQKLNRKSLLVVISGPSGVGKDVIIEEMVRQNPKDYHFTVTATTRKPRDNELNGVAQHFGIRGFPFWVLIDSNGDIITRLSGSYTKDQFEIILSNLVKYDKEN